MAGPERTTVDMVQVPFTGVQSVQVNVAPREERDDTVVVLKRYCGTGAVAPVDDGAGP